MTHRESDLCLHYDDCENADFCLRCLIPIKHSEESGLPCCFRRKDENHRN